MKIALVGVTVIKLGRHNLKDPRLDQVDKLVSADKKVPAQVEILGDDQLALVDATLATEETQADLALKDLEFIETRLGRGPEPGERIVLEKLQGLLESGKFVFNAGLTAEELAQIAAHGFATARPVTVATAAELADPDGLLLRCFREAGWISFLTVGGKENRAWPIRRGTTAWDAAGSIHTDLHKGFIRAEVISFEDLVAAGGETQAKRAGKLRLEMKPYVMQDYDVVNFRFNK